MVNRPRILEVSNTLENGRLMGEFRSIPEALVRLGIKRETLYKLVAEGTLKAKIDTIGGRTIFKFTDEELERVAAILLPKRKRVKGKSMKNE